MNAKNISAGSKVIAKSDLRMGMHFTAGVEYVVESVIDRGLGVQYGMWDDGGHFQAVYAYYFQAA